MRERGVAFTIVLSVAGTILAWLPLLAPLAFMAMRQAGPGGGDFLLDYLMPAELFPVALAGGLLLAWASLRGRLRRLPVLAGLAAMPLLLGAALASARLTGLADGTNEATGWRMTLLLALLGLYAATILALAIVGLLLTRDLLKAKRAG